MKARHTAEVIRSRASAFLSGALSRLSGRPATWWYYPTAGGLALCLTATYLLLRSERLERFPRLAPGFYVGSVTGAFPESDAAAAPFVLEAEAAGKITTVLLAPGFAPVTADTVPRGRDGSETGWVHPILVKGERSTLKLTGAPVGDGSYEGAAVDVEGGARGRWSLRVTDPAVFVPDQGDERDVTVWLRQLEEWDAVEKRIIDAETAVPELRAEAARLERFIVEGEQLKKNADRKLTDVKARLAETESALRTKTARLADLKERYDLAARLSSAGRLAALGRESLRKEGEWLDVVLRAAEPPPGAPDEEAAAERGTRMLEMKRRIDAERKLTAELLASAREAAYPPARAPLSPQDLP